MITERIHATSNPNSRCDHRSVRWDADHRGLMFCGPDGGACCSHDEGEFPTEESAEPSINWYRSGPPAPRLQQLRAELALAIATEHDGATEIAAAEPNPVRSTRIMADSWERIGEKVAIARRGGVL